MKKLKPIIIKDKNLRRNNESNISNISNVLNKKSLNLTRTTDYSNSQDISLNDNNNSKKEKKIKKIISKPLIISSEENKKLIKGKSELNINVTENGLPMNVNYFYHLIHDNLFGSCESLNWALGLRLAKKNKKNINSKKLGEPTFYLEDQKKYLEKNSEKKPLLNELNPDFSKIEHLTHGKTKGNINYSQFSFSSCLRDINHKKCKEKEKAFKLTPLPKINGYKYKIKCLAPITTTGIDNLNKIENYIPKNYEIKYENTKVANDKIKKKILTINRSFTLCGFGESLGDQKYNNKFRELNIFANRELLANTSNPISKFELGLRNYRLNKISNKSK